MEQATRFDSMARVREVNRATGHHFFSLEALSTFSSRISSELIGGRYFITSERDSGWITSAGERLAAWDGKRRYTIREAFADGTIRDIGGYGAFVTRSAAVRTAREFEECDR